MTISVVFFAAARDVTGCDRLQLKLADGATIADVKRELRDLHPDLEPVLKNSMWSINCKYAAERDPIPDGAEIGLILPVSGG